MLFCVLFFINIMCFQKSIRLDFNLSKSSIFGDDGALRILWVYFPIIKLDYEIFLVYFLQPGSLDLIHSHVHRNESLVNWCDVIQSFFLQEIDFTNDLSLHVWWYDCDNFAVCFQLSFINDFKINFVFMYASVPIFTLCNQCSINLQRLNFSEPLYSITELHNSTIVFFFSLSTWLFYYFNL